MSGTTPYSGTGAANGVVGKAEQTVADMQEMTKANGIITTGQMWAQLEMKGQNTSAEMGNAIKNGTRIS